MGDRCLYELRKNEVVLAKEKYAMTLCFLLIDYSTAFHQFNNIFLFRSEEEIAFRKMSLVNTSRLSCRVQPSIAEITKQREVIKVSSVGEDSFSVVSYNILADCHMEPEW